MLLKENEIIEELISIKFIALEDKAPTVELKYSEMADILDTKNNEASTTGHTLRSGIYEISRLKMKLMSLTPNDVKVWWY